MGILLWIIFGGIVGWLASYIMKSSNGLIMNIILGIIGALVGGFIMSFFGFSGVSGFNIWSFIVALIGAIVVIWIGRLLAGSR